MENEMAECLTSLFNALSAKSEEETTKMFGEAIKHAKESKLDISNPEHFDCFINHKLKKGIKLLASTLHEPSVCQDKDKPNFIYANYSFLENHIRKLCELREGSACCADKSRYILKMYLKYSVTGEIPEFNPNIEEYWIPNFGDNEMWIKYCNSLYELHYGDTKEYFKTYAALIQCEIRKFKHILHTWYIRFKDGQVVKFSDTWDDKQENPLDNEYFDKGDYYVVYRKYVENRNYEIYEDEEFIRNHYCKVPKTDIDEIYKVSEEKMV